MRHRHHTGPGGEGVVDSSTVSNHLVLISLLAAIAQPDVAALEGLSEVAAGTGSEDAAAGLQELIDLAPTQSRGEFLELRDHLLHRPADAAALMLETG